MATTARLKFLDEAADLLAFTSPTAAAQLRSTQLESFQGDVAKASKIRKHQICGGCGELLAPGWNCSVKSKKRTRQDRLTQAKDTKPMTLQCARCNSITKTEKARRLRIRPVQQQAVVQPPAKSENPSGVRKEDRPAQSSSTPSASTNEGSIKKRNRNKKTSLQSLLADRKAAEPKQTLGLGLMDFMKT